MQIKILKDIQGTHFLLKAGEIYSIPFTAKDNKKHTMTLEYVESENKDIFEDGFFILFSSDSKNANDGYSGCGIPLKHKIHFTFIKNL